jgi:hypothetical protein
MHGPNRIGGVMVNILASSAADIEFESWSGQTKDYKIGIESCLTFIFMDHDVKLFQMLIFRKLK